MLPFYNETKNGRKARFNDIDKATGDMSMPGEPARPVIEVASFCQDPGLPFKSRLSPIQSYYVDGERVTYTCENFISLKQYRTCKKGEWVGEVPICGKCFCFEDDIPLLLFYNNASNLNHQVTPCATMI